MHERLNKNSKGNVEPQAADKNSKNMKVITITTLPSV